MRKISKEKIPPEGNEKLHWADKPGLRDLFWFLVLPYKLGQYWERQRKRIGDGEA